MTTLSFRNAFVKFIINLLYIKFIIYLCADTMNIVCKILRNFDHINVVVIEHVIIVQV